MQSDAFAHRTFRYIEHPEEELGTGCKIVPQQEERLAELK